MKFGFSSEKSGSELTKPNLTILVENIKFEAFSSFGSDDKKKKKNLNNNAEVSPQIPHRSYDL